MDSEKVNEIKKASECCSNSEIYDCTGCPYRNVSSDCQNNLIYDMGVYINELESENEKQYKRIMELEQDLVHADENVFYRECNVALQENKIKAEGLKRFAERLVEKYGYAPLTHELDEDIEIHLTASELYETLKEFLDGKV